MTGATGLVGRFVLRDLLLRGHRLAVVVRSGKRETVRERVESIMQLWDQELGRPLPRPVCLEGDINQPRLGLSGTDYDWCAAHADRVLHSAAVLSFHGSSQDDDPWRTNVGGTRNVLNACREWGVRDLHYVSTAYVCGTRDGVIREDEFDCNQGFRNHYEESKYKAEQLVRGTDFLDSVTVYRPVVVGGDSSTGYTNTYHGIYGYLKLMSILVWNVEPGRDGRRHTPVQLEMTGNERRNLVPADWVSEVICRLLENPSAHGGTYHLAGSQPITPREVIDAGYTYFNSYGVDFIGPRNNEASFVSSMDQAARENTAIYQPYETTDPVFDTEKLNRFAGDLPCPKIDRDMLHRFWRFGEADRWGKNRPPKPHVPLWIADHLLRRLAYLGQTNGGNGHHNRESVGLDLHGPGGGQWQMKLRGKVMDGLRPGLPLCADAQLTCPVADWQAIAKIEAPEAIWRLRKIMTLSEGTAADLPQRVYAALFAPMTGQNQLDRDQCAVAAS